MSYRSCSLASFSALLLFFNMGNAYAQSDFSTMSEIVFEGEYGSRIVANKTSIAIAQPTADAPQHDPTLRSILSLYTWQKVLGYQIQKRHSLPDAIAGSKFGLIVQKKALPNVPEEKPFLAANRQQTEAQIDPGISSRGSIGDPLISSTHTRLDKIDISSSKCNYYEAELDVIRECYPGGMPDDLIQWLHTRMNTRSFEKNYQNNGPIELWRQEVGKVTIYGFDGIQWTLRQTLYSPLHQGDAGNNFGIFLEMDDEHMLIGEQDILANKFGGRIHHYEYVNSKWVYQSTIPRNAGFLMDDVSTGDIAYPYFLFPDEWSITVLKHSGEQRIDYGKIDPDLLSGGLIDVNSNGELLIGDIIYTTDGKLLEKVQQLPMPSNYVFGDSSISMLNDNHALIYAEKKDENNGAFFLYTRRGNTWMMNSMLTSPDQEYTFAHNKRPQLVDDRLLISASFSDAKQWNIVGVGPVLSYLYVYREGRRELDKRVTAPSQFEGQPIMSIAPGFLTDTFVLLQSSKNYFGNYYYRLYDESNITHDET